MLDLAHNCISAQRIGSETGNYKKGPRVIAWCVGWSDQGEVGVFRRDCFRTARSEQSIRELFAVVRLRKPPRGGIDQGETLYRG